jgi:hypothetical protein
LWVRNRSDGQEGDDIDEHFDGLTESQSPEDLMDAIITLDDLYQQGEIPEAAYLERRATLKENLRNLVD